MCHSSEIENIFSICFSGNQSQQPQITPEEQFEREMDTLLGPSHSNRSFSPIICLRTLSNPCYQRRDQGDGQADDTENGEENPEDRNQNENDDQIEEAEEAVNLPGNLP